MTGGACISATNKNFSFQSSQRIFGIYVKYLEFFLNFEAILKNVVINIPNDISFERKATILAFI
jgi:hypothetical protein